MKKALCSMLVFVIVIKAGQFEQAFVCVPVADASAMPLSEYGEVVSLYERLPSAPDKGVCGCLRIHQLKCNELVTIKRQTSEHEYECKASNFIYTNTEGKQSSTFWILKKHLIPLKELPKERDKLPPPIDKSRSPEDYNLGVLTLTWPWCDAKSKKTYSVGTRFARCPEKDGAAYAVYAYNTKKRVYEVRYVPRENALVDYPKTPEETVSCFMKLIKRWIYESSGLIPYVFGGCSFTGAPVKESFKICQKKLLGRAYSYWQRESLSQGPLVGFDCSALILCAAQIVGMPYYVKTTSQLKTSLRLLKKGEALEEGDLIWYNGHVMIVSDIKKNMLIEAAGYESGWGKVHEIALDKVFNQKEYGQLLASYHKRSFLRRLTSKGKPYRSIYRLKIYKLKSIWEATA